MRRKIMPLIKIRGLPLQQEHWLEVLDRKHRYGSDLKVYHEYWYGIMPHWCILAAQPFTQEMHVVECQCSLALPH